jgi:hypothetical protein
MVSRGNHSHGSIRIIWKPNCSKNLGGDQLVTDGRSPRLYSMTNHRVTASWKANDLEKDSVFRT